MAFSLSSKAAAFAVGLLCWSLGGIAFATDPLVGTLPGDFSVDNKGAANYSIPLPLPHGRQGMQPKLSLQYSSQAGNGPLGVGFTLSTGFSQAITRGRTIQARDGVTRGVVFDNAKDKLYLDGKRLVCTSEPTYSYGAPGSTYRTEVDSFVSVTTAGSNGNIETFIVTDKSGTKMTFGKLGSELDGYQVGVFPVSATTYQRDTLAYTWALKRIEDSVGNYIKITYLDLGNGEYVPSTIDYTGCDSPIVAPRFRVGLSYNSGSVAGSSARRDTSDSYVALRRFAQTKRLDQITVSIPRTSQTTAIYNLGYEYSPNQGPTRLKTIAAKLRDPVSGTLLDTPATTFNWSDNVTSFTTTGPMNSSGVVTTFDGYEDPLQPEHYAFGDVNGDGLDDCVWFGNSVQVQLSNGTGLGAKQTWATMSLGATIWKLADLNGDGRKDIVCGKVVTVSGECQLYALISTGTAFAPLGGGTTPTQVYSGTGDFTGLNLNGGPGDELTFADYRSTSAGALTNRIAVADFTGDGLDDILIHRFDGKLRLLKNQGNSSFATPTPYDIGASPVYGERVWEGWFPDLLRFMGYNLVTVDVSTIPCELNGDGITDYAWGETRQIVQREDSVFLATETKSYWAVTGLPGGGFSPAAQIVADTWELGSFDAKYRNSSFVVLPGDVNGDGLNDFTILQKAYMAPVAGQPRSGEFFLRHEICLSKGSAGAPQFERRYPLETTAQLNNPAVPANWMVNVGGQSVLPWFDKTPWNRFLDEIVLTNFFGASSDKQQLVNAVGTSGGDGVALCDVNLDGCDDYVWYVTGSSQAGWWVMYAVGGGYSAPEPAPLGWLAPLQIDFPGAQYYQVSRSSRQSLDLNGDGIRDYAYANHTIKEAPGFVGFHLSAALRGGRLASIADGLGRTTDISYKPITSDSVYTPGPSVSYPIRELRNATYVVADVYKDSGSSTPAGRARFSYQYSGNRLDLSGRGALGFHAFVTLDRQTNLFKYQFLAQSFPMTGLTAREQTYRYWESGGDVKFRLVNSHDNTVVFDEVVNPAASNAPWGTVYPFVSQAVEYRWEDSPTQAHFTLPKAGGPETKPEALFTAARPLGHHIAITAASLFDNQTAVLKALPGTYAASDRAKSTTDRTLDWSAVGLNTVAGATDYAAFHALFGGSDYRKITYGNLRQLSTNFGDGFTEQVETTYKPPVGALTGLVDTVKTTVGWKENGIAKTAVAPLKTYTYWGATPLVATETINAGDAVVTNAEAKLTTTTAYARDTLGRVTSTTLSGYSNPGAEGATVFGTVADDDNAARHIGSFTTATVAAFDAAWDLPTSVANAYGHATATAYHPFLGLPTSVTGPNGDSVSTSYDAIGRTVKVRDELKNLETTSTFTWDTSQTVAPPANATGIGPGAPIVGVVAIAGKSVYAVCTTATAQPPVTTYYDRLGRVIRTVKEGFGNKKAVTDTVYNTLGQVTAVSLPYDPADAATGPFWTRTGYDALGRIVTVNAPNGTVTTHTYRGRCTTVTVDAPDRDPQSNTTFVDAKGRTIKVWNANITPVFTPIDPTTSASTSGTPASIEYTLDGFGRMLTTVLNNQAQPITATYDALGRQTSLDDPDKGLWTYLNNALGHVVYQKDAKETVTRSTFDRLGRPLSRRTAETAGPVEDSAWSYYDTAANASGSTGTVHHLVAKGDQGWIGAPHRERSSTTGAPGYAATAGASATETLHYYDSLGRPAIVLSGIDGKWFYTCTEYDAAGRVAAVRHFWKPAGHEAPSDQPYVWQDFGYSYTYDSESYLLELRDATGQIWWEADPAAGYDHLDRPVLVRKGHGHWTRRTYRATDGTLAALNTGPTAGSGTVQNLRFEFDGLGNLTTRADDLAGLSESFGYDALNRLTKRGGEDVVAYHANGNINWKRDVTGYQSPAFVYSPTKPHAVTSAFGCTMTYDANGNLLTRTGANGEEWATRWAGFDKPRWLAKTVGATTAGSEFVYNANRSRVLQIEFDSVNGTGVSATPKHYTRKRLYAWGATGEIDYVNTAATGGGAVPAPIWSLSTIRLYVPGPDGVIGAMEFWPNGPVEKNPRPLVYHYDHLGSVAVVTPLGDRTGHIARDDNGKQARHSFDAWGQRRDPVDWTGVPVDTSAGGPAAVTPRGFTGHEMMDGQALVNMNGRIYDALLGRFLSADILVQNPASLQSFNRYSYVMNNPLSLTDPSGFKAVVESADQLAKRLEEKRQLDAHCRRAEAQVGGPDLKSVITGKVASDGADSAESAGKPSVARAERAADGQGKGTPSPTVNPTTPVGTEAKRPAEGSTDTRKSSDCPDNTGITVRWRGTPRITNPATGGYHSDAVYCFSEDANGVLIQMVFVESNVVDSRGEPTPRIAGITITKPYWELWTVRDGVAAPCIDGINDSFISYGYKSPSAGSHSQVGLLQFYPNKTEADFPDMKEHQVGPADVMKASYNAPPGWTTEGAIEHRVTVDFSGGWPTLSTVPAIPTNSKSISVPINLKHN